MHENNQNSHGERNRPNITTSVMTFWDDNGTQLRVAYLENGVSIAFWVPQISETGSRKYPPELRYSTIVNTRILSAILKKITDDMMDAYNQGKEEYSCAVFTNKAHTTILQVELRQGEFYIKYHHNCDPTTNVPQGTISFKFDTYPVMTNYNPVDGSLSGEILQVDFYLFVSALKTYVENVGGAISGHGNAVSNNYQNRKMMDYLQGIANAVHASLPAPSYGYNYNKPQTPVNQNLNPEIPNGSLPSPELTEVEIQDLIG